MEYRIERISPKLYKFTQQLYKESFGIKKTLDQITTKYNTEGFGKKDVGYFALDTNNKPAAYYGVFPIVATYKGQDIKIAQSGDTMTHPNHQKKGLFTMLAKETYKLAKEEDIDFVFGFPNENSLPGFEKKLDWKFYGHMKQFTIKSGGIPLSEMAHKFNPISPLFHFLSNGLSKKYKIELDQNVIDQFNNQEDLKIKRDLNFFEYKNSSNAFCIEINGFIIYLKIEDHIKIGDVVKFDSSRTNEFIATLKQIGKQAYSGKIILSVSENHWLFDILEKKIKSEDILPIGFLSLNNEYPFEKMIFTRADFDTF